jgi:hypothetical protein
MKAISMLALKLVVSKQYKWLNIVKNDYCWEKKADTSDVIIDDLELIIVSLSQTRYKKLSIT